MNTEKKAKTLAAKGFAFAVLLAGFLGLALASAPVSAAPTNGTGTVRSFYDTLLYTMKNAKTLGQNGRYAQLEPVIAKTFDLPFMTRMAVGTAWSTMTPTQRQQATEAFGRYISAIYADRFDGYSGEQLKVIGAQPYAAGAIVDSEIVKSDGQPVRINYLMRRNGQSWQISDVYLNGTISELAARRAEFASILQSKGVDGLIAALNRKASLLAAGQAAS